MVGDAIKSILSGVTANVNPSLIPHNRASQWVIYRQVSRIPNNTKTDGGHYDQYRFQLDIYARTYEKTDALAFSVKQTLDEYSGTIASVKIDRIFFENETDSWETIEEEHYYRRIQDYMIFIKPLFCDQYAIVYNSFENKPSQADSVIQNTLLSTLYNAGIYAKCEFIDIFSTHSNSLNEAYKNWKSPGTFDPSAVNDPAWTQYAGIKGAWGTTMKLVNLNFIPSTNGTLISQNSICVIIGVGDNVAEDLEDFGSRKGDGTIALYILSRGSTDYVGFRCNSSGVDTYSNTDSKKHFAMSRNNANTYDSYVNKTKTVLTENSTGLPDVSLYACGKRHGTNVPVACNKTLRYVIVASYLTEAEIGIVIDAMEAYLDNYSMGLI